jgi:hypothetical protein
MRAGNARKSRRLGCDLDAKYFGACRCPIDSTGLAAIEVRDGIVMDSEIAGLASRHKAGRN